MLNYNDKIVITTGAARGIGFAIAKAYAEAGATSIIIDLKKEDVDAAAAKLTEAGYKAAGYAANVVDSAKIADIFKEIKTEYGKIDVLVNNAGITRDGLIMKMKEADWDMVLDVNLKGTFVCTQKVTRYMMKQRHGVILNIASVIGLMGNAGQANYAASKGGIIALTKSTAKELSSRNIRVNAVAPGFIETEMTKLLSEEVVAGYAKVIPLGIMGQPENIADLCLFLGSDRASYITGQTIQVDGGLIM